MIQLYNFGLYKNGKLIAKALYYEDLEFLVEEFKRLNRNEIDRREFEVKLLNSGQVFAKWNRK